MKSTSRKVLLLLMGALMTPNVFAQPAGEQQSLEELRDTVINLLQALVDQGVISKEKAQALVKQAQAKAAADAAKAAADAAKVAAADQGAVRVPYVPQIVKDEISKQVAAEVEPSIVANVEQKAKDEGWGVPAALPEWLKRVRVYGDVTFRAQADLYAKDNTPNEFLDFNSINAAGSLSGAGANEYLNVTEDRYRLRLRARLGADALISDTVHAGIRLSSGSLTDPGSESQNEGNSFARYTVGIDQAYIRWDEDPIDRIASFSAIGGRFANPWLAPTELIFARDLTFEGLSFTGRFGPAADSADRSHGFFTLGASPVQEIPLANSNNKWLLGAQLGTNLRFEDGQRLRVAAAYYDFIHVTGRQNAPDTTDLNYTAPAFIRFGNTVFDIANSTTNANTALFALAAEFRLANITAQYEIPVERYALTFTADAVRNIGYNSADVQALTGVYVPPKIKGYVAEVSFGDHDVDQWGRWRARVGYRYVQRDAVLDSLTDADFHEGGTNALGYYVWGELGLTRDTWLRLRYLSGNLIDAPQESSGLLLKYGLDIIQLDLGTRF